MTDKCYRVCIDAANAHTNLNTWGAVIAILEGGMLYGNPGQHKTAARVIAIAKDEQAKFLRIYDAALEDAGDEP